MKRPLPTPRAQAVKVYRNLNDKCFSIMEGSHVTGHAISVILEDVSFLIRKGSQKRAIAQKRKNVHAFACGQLVAATISSLGLESTEGKRVRYNYEKDFHLLNGETITSCKTLVLAPTGMLAFF